MLSISVFEDYEEGKLWSVISNNTCFIVSNSKSLSARGKALITYGFTKQTQGIAKVFDHQVIVSRTCIIGRKCSVIDVFMDQGIRTTFLFRNLFRKYHCYFYKLGSNWKYIYRSPFSPLVFKIPEKYSWRNSFSVKL